MLIASLSRSTQHFQPKLLDPQLQLMISNPKLQALSAKLYALRGRSMPTSRKLTEQALACTKSLGILFGMFRGLHKEAGLLAGCC